MTKTLKQLIEDYKDGVLTTINLQIVEEVFENEIIETSDLQKIFIENSRFQNVKFINIDFSKFAWYESVFENCVFENINFQSGEFIECTCQNCFFINCDFTETEFEKIIFEECEFQTNEKGSTYFINVNFTSCYFNKTLFTNLPPISLFGTILTNSKFSFSKRSIEFTGSFFLMDLLHSQKGIHELLTETKVTSWED